MINVPLMLIPFAIYNVLIIGSALAPWDAIAVRADLPSGAELTLSMGEVLVLCALGALLLDILKAARRGASARLELLLSGVVVLACLAELALIEAAGTSTFVLLTVLALVDGLCSAAMARRAVSGGRLALEVRPPAL